MKGGLDSWLAVGLLSASLLVGGASVGCESGRNTLGGSVGESYDLSFDTTRARLYSSELAVEYVRESGEVPVRVALDRGGGSVGTGSYSLGDRGSVVGRVEQNRLPEMRSGELILREFEARTGARVRGRFSAELESANDDSSLSLRGRFATTLEVVDENQGYRFGRDAGNARDVGDVSDVVDTTDP